MQTTWDWADSTYVSNDPAHPSLTRGLCLRVESFAALAASLDPVTLAKAGEPIRRKHGDPGAIENL